MSNYQDTAKTRNELDRVMRQRPEPPDPPFAQAATAKPFYPAHAPRKPQRRYMVTLLIHEIRVRKEELTPAVQEYIALQALDAFITGLKDA